MGWTNLRIENPGSQLTKASQSQGGSVTLGDRNWSVVSVQGMSSEARGPLSLYHQTHHFEIRPFLWWLVIHEGLFFPFLVDSEAFPNFCFQG